MNYKLILIDRVILFYFLKHNNWKWQFVIAMNHLHQAKYFSLSVPFFGLSESIVHPMISVSLRNAPKGKKKRKEKAFVSVVLFGDWRYLDIS